jgi:C4-type Zn-finger protein
MAAVGAVQVHCPECDVAVPITTEITSTSHEGNVLVMSVVPDLTDVIAHVWTHEAPADGLG